MRYQLSIIIVLFLMLLSIVASAQQIRGDYLETRSADVYTGQCFANGEVNLVGNAEHHGAAMLRAGRFATVQTRSIGDKDHLCGNEETYYPPLTQLSHSMPAVALTDSYSGPGLGTSWDLHGKRSAFVGTFAR